MTLQPSWWKHPSLTLHNQWFSRRALQLKARAVLVGLVVMLLFIWALNLPLWCVALALLGAAYPAPRPAKTLQEIEQKAGAAYSTALTAPTDQHGLQSRLLEMAQATQKTTDLPELPLLEGLGMALLLSLLLVFPPRVTTNSAVSQDRAITRESIANPNLPNGTNSQSAQPVLDAPSRDAPPAGADAKPGQAASGGSASEQNLGALKPGGGNAQDDPAAISKEFLDALERGAVRDRDPNKAGQNASQVEDANPPTAGQSGSSSGKDGQNGQGNNQNNKNGQQGTGDNQNGQSGNSSQPNGQQGNQAGQNGQGSNSSGQNKPGQAGANQAGNGTKPNQNRNAQGNNIDRGNSEDFQGSDPRGSSGSGKQSTSPGQGTRNANGSPVAANRQAGQGKLEYLQGTVRGNQVRSGALQLPGDSSNGFTSPTGSTAYRRAAESAVLDPKLPPEYQEMLKNYYR